MWRRGATAEAGFDLRLCRAVNQGHETLKYLAVTSDFLKIDADLDGIRASEATWKLVTGEQQLLCQPG